MKMQLGVFSHSESEEKEWLKRYQAQAHTWPWPLLHTATLLRLLVLVGVPVGCSLCSEALMLVRYLFFGLGMAGISEMRGWITWLVSHFLMLVVYDCVLCIVYCAL
jgi:hypothetical protein